MGECLVNDVMKNLNSICMRFNDMISFASNTVLSNDTHNIYIYMYTLRCTYTYTYIWATYHTNIHSYLVHLGSNSLSHISIIETSNRNLQIIYHLLLWRFFQCIPRTEAGDMMASAPRYWSRTKSHPSRCKCPGLSSFQYHCHSELHHWDILSGQSIINL